MITFGSKVFSNVCNKFDKVGSKIVPFKELMNKIIYLMGYKVG